MYTLLTKNILTNYRVNNKTIKQRSIILNDLSSLMLLPLEAKVMVFFEHSISLSYLKDLESALNLDILIVVNNETDENLCKHMFNTKLVVWDFIDGELVSSIAINDEKQLDHVSSRPKAKAGLHTLESLVKDAEKLTNLSSGSESAKLIATAFLNIMSSKQFLDNKARVDKELLEQTLSENLALKTTLNTMAADMEEFIRMYKQVQVQISSRNILDVIKDTRSVQLPSSVTSLVIKNYGIPYLPRFINALKDALTISFDRYTKVLYIMEADSVAIEEIKRSQYFLLTEETKASDLLRNDMLMCVGNVRDPIDFLINSSSLDTLIIVDSRRTTTELISGQTMTMYTAPDLDTAMNLNLDPEKTITASERSTYTLREAEFIGKKRHALRNNELVLRVANTLIGGS